MQRKAKTIDILWRFYRRLICEILVICSACSSATNGRRIDVFHFIGKQVLHSPHLYVDFHAHLEKHSNVVYIARVEHCAVHVDLSLVKSRATWQLENVPQKESRYGRMRRKTNFQQLKRLRANKRRLH